MNDSTRSKAYSSALNVQAHHLRASVRAGRVATKRAPLTPERKAAIEEEIQKQLEGRKRLDDELVAKENGARSRVFQGHNHSAGTRTYPL